MRPFVAGADAHFEGFTRLHGVDPALSEDATMEEGIARSIGEFDEPKPLLGSEPLDDSTDRWTGGSLEPSLAEPGSGSERTGL